ncbi:MAG: ParA family protein [Deltaproteobacteria bacterium]|nr:ParA family protein [Deltaproteobacteria bacterium]
MKTIAVCCGKGGVGKTFSALSIAVELGIKSSGKKRILIVDLDPSINTSVRISGSDERGVTIAELFQDMTIDPGQAIYPATENYPGVSVMASSDKLDFVDQLITKRKNPDSILRRILKQVEGQFDVVIIDCPPSRGTLVSNALVACDAYITPFGLDDASIDGVLAIERLVEELINEEVLSERPVNLGAFCTAYEKERSRATKNVIHVANEYLKGTMLNIQIPGTSHVREAVSHQSTLQFDRKHKVCLAYEQLTNHIIKKMSLRGYSL